MKVNYGLVKSNQFQIGEYDSVWSLGLLTAGCWLLAAGRAGCCLLTF